MVKRGKKLTLALCFVFALLSIIFVGAFFIDSENLEKIFEKITGEAIAGSASGSSQKMLSILSAEQEQEYLNKLEELVSGGCKLPAGVTIPETFTTLEEMNTIVNQINCQKCCKGYMVSSIDTINAGAFMPGYSIPYSTEIQIGIVDTPLIFNSQIGSLPAGLSVQPAVINQLNNPHKYLLKVDPPVGSSIGTKTYNFEFTSSPCYSEAPTRYKKTVQVNFEVKDTSGMIDECPSWSKRAKWRMVVSNPAQLSGWVADFYNQVLGNTFVMGRVIVGNNFKCVFQSGPYQSNYPKYYQTIRWNPNYGRFDWEYWRENGAGPAQRTLITVPKTSGSTTTPYGIYSLGGSDYIEVSAG